MTTAADALYKTVKEFPGSVEVLALRMGVNAQILRNKVNPNITTNHPTLHDVEMIMDITGDYRVLDALADSTGHVLTKVDIQATPSDMAVLEMITHVWVENGNVGNAVNDTLADGRVERHEVVKVRQAVYRTQQALIDMLTRLEGMAEK